MKFTTLAQAAFWEAVYVAATSKYDHTHANAVERADRALLARCERMTDKLTSEESLIVIDPDTGIARRL